ncbi:MAG: 16S rRNA (uracil(1498)-N(3))-methyltransferase [Sedimentisphaerales bacterium]|nr:16S rRNA (uracil(1498)-N(3))-methyltransferase [Sedimentisphaerales bacterium]
MPVHRFYCRPIKELKTELAGTEAHHLISVLRLKAGEKVEVFDGEGTVAEAAIGGIKKREVELRIEQIKRYPPRTTGRIIIAPGIAKGRRFDWLIEKCTELRTDRICPVIFERSIKQASNPKILERWQNLVISAAKQSRRIFLTKIDAPRPLGEVMKTLKKEYPKLQIIVGGLSPEAFSLTGQLIGSADVAAFIGPEGGFTENETELLKNEGAKFVRLTDTVLRTETAALAFASVLCALRDIAKESP